MLGDYGNAGSIAVQTVAAAEDKRFSLFLIIPGEGIGDRIGIIVQRRMDRHAGRFVDDNQILIFI